MFERVRRLLSTSADEEDQQIWYRTTQVYVAGIRRSCTEALPERKDPDTNHRFRTEAEKGAKIVKTRRGAGPRVGASEELLNEMEKLEKILMEATDGYIQEECLLDQLRKVEEKLERECP